MPLIHSYTSTPKSFPTSILSDDIQLTTFRDLKTMIPHLGLSTSPVSLPSKTQVPFLWLVTPNKEIHASNAQLLLNPGLSSAINPLGCLPSRFFYPRCYKGADTSL